MECILLRGPIIFDVRRQYWLFHSPLGPVQHAFCVTVSSLSKALQGFLGGPEFLEHYLTLQSRIFALSAGNRLTCLLLFLVELFSPDRANLSSNSTNAESGEGHSSSQLTCHSQHSPTQSGSRQVISAAQDKYLSLLKRYLESTNEHADVKALFPSLLLTLCSARRLASQLTRIAQQIDWSNVEPLLSEMFSLR